MKFENDIKQKLEERKLTPSTSAWNSLEDRLDKENKKKNNKGFWWFGMAASFVGVLIITSLMFSNKNIETPIRVVDVENSKPELDLITPAKNNIKEVINEKENNIQKNNNKIEKRISSNQNLKIKEKEIILKEIKNNNVIVSNDNVNAKESDKPLVAKETLTVEEQKINAIIAEIKELDKDANSFTASSEVDALLQEAQREIAFNKLYRQAIKTVDVDGLLQDVEEDLDQSFREKVFKKLLAGFNDAKTAVASRNN